MSAPSKEITHQKPVVGICLANDFRVKGGCLHVDFSHRLNWRGTDFSVYANTGYAENTGDSVMLVNIINAILIPTNGVDSIDVRAFKLNIHGNMTTDVKELMKQLGYAVERAGFAVQMMQKS